MIARLSCRPNDPGYNAWLEIHRGGQKWAFTVDGKTHEDVHTIDFEGGFLVKYAVDEDGRKRVKFGDTVDQAVRGAVVLEVWEGDDMILRLPEVE